MLAANKKGYFPFTPATNLLFGLQEALRMLEEEGLNNVFARHSRHGEATRRAVRAWGIEIVCLNPDEFSSSLTGVLVPIRPQRRRIAKNHPRSIQHVAGKWPRKAAGKIFRIGHLGHFNDLCFWAR